MAETLYHPESKQSQEYHEQSPEDFVDSLKIFDSYEKVPTGKEKSPEWQMPFTGDEQELAKGIRGELEELAATAKNEGRTVSIPELFSAFEDKLRESDADEETKDQLFLAATKMRYHLQLRFDKANEGVPVTQSTPTTDEPKSRVNERRGDRKAHQEYVATAFRDILNSPIGPQFRDAYTSSTRDNIWRDQTRTQESQSAASQNEAHGNERNYTSEAQDIVRQYTGGVDYKDLDKKAQGKVNRSIAREYHPDMGGDEELFKAINAETDTKNGPDTRSY
jgi:hypothetical protein